MRSLPSALASRAVGKSLTASGLAFALIASAAHATYPGRNGVLSVSYGFGCPGTRVATLKPDGGRLRMLTPSTCREVGRVGRASWSPDGRRMIFAYQLPLGVASNLEWTRFATMGADGSQRRDVPLPPATGLSVRGFEGQAAFAREDPTFTSDGRHVLYSRMLWEPPQFPGDSWSYPLEIWSAALDGSRDHRLGAGGLARMSPDGRRIAYVRRGTADDDPGEVWLMSARTGRPIRRLLARGARSIDWSPDGTRVLLTSSRGSVFEPADLYVVRVSGAPLRRLTSTPRTSESDAVWSPDGRRLAVVREIRRPAGDCCEYITQAIWMMRPDGTAQRRLRGPWTRHDEDGQGYVQISWQPLPAR